jgi:hypothetical protein
MQGWKGLRSRESLSRIEVKIHSRQRRRAKLRFETAHVGYTPLQAEVAWDLLVTSGLASGEW